MDNTAILECLEQKKALFRLYEECTSKMGACSIEDLQDYITERAGLANEIDQLNREIDAFCDTSDDPELMRDAVANRGNYGDFPQYMLPVYNKASEILTCISHVYNMEPQIKQRMSEESARLLQKIRSNSDTAKVYHYVKNLKSSDEGDGLFSNRKRV